MGSGCGIRSGLAHKHVVAIGFGWKGWDSVSVVAIVFWILLSFGFDA